MLGRTEDALQGKCWSSPTQTWEWGPWSQRLKGFEKRKSCPLSLIHWPLWWQRNKTDAVAAFVVQPVSPESWQQPSLTGRRMEAHREARCLDQLPPIPSFPVGVLKSFAISHSKLWGTSHKHTASRQFVDLLGQLTQINGRRSPCVVWFPTWGCMESWNITPEGLGRLSLLVDGRKPHSTWSLANVNAGVQIYLVACGIMFQQPLCMTANGTSWENMASRKNQAW